jgi:hypothetical protein
MVKVKVYELCDDWVPRKENKLQETFLLDPQMNEEITIAKLLS